MSTILTFRAYPQNVSHYRSRGAYELRSVDHGISKSEAFEKEITPYCHFDEDLGMWFNESGNHVAELADTFADLGDWTVVTYTIDEINEDDTELIRAIEKEGWASNTLETLRKRFAEV